MNKFAAWLERRRGPREPPERPKLAVVVERWLDELDAPGRVPDELRSHLNRRGLVGRTVYRRDEIPDPTERRAALARWFPLPGEPAAPPGGQDARADGTFGDASLTDLQPDRLLARAESFIEQVGGSGALGPAGRLIRPSFGTTESDTDDELPEHVGQTRLAFIAMDEFCRWATLEGLVPSDPFADTRSTLPAAAPLPKMYHGGPALTAGYDIDLAISGGGHRATLYGLGAVMALHDAHRIPRRISSVSGGSITNAFLAHHHWSRAAREHEEHMDWEAATEALFRTVCRGVLTRSWLAGIALVLLVPPVAFVIATIGGWLPRPTVTLFLGAVWATAVMFRGVIIEQLLGRAYFGRGRPTLGDLRGEAEHIICATDLVAGVPVYASCDGTVVVSHPDGGREVYRDASRLPVARLVRASAGFPGIPPRRIALHRYDITESEASRPRRVAFLSDGGIWNNLATQAFEDALVVEPWVVLVADASASMPSANPLPLYVPGVAELVALLRQVKILNANTVTPRAAAYREGVRREVLFPGDARFKASTLFPVSACIERPRDVVAGFRAWFKDSHVGAYDSVGGAGQHVQEWEERRQAVRRRLEDIEDRDDYRRLAAMADVGSAPPTVPAAAIAIPASGSETAQDARAIRPTHQDEPDPVAWFPTTLGAVPADVGLALVGRGYANTALTLYIAGLVDDLVTPHGWLARPPGVTA